MPNVHKTKQRFFRKRSLFFFVPVLFFLFLLLSFNLGLTKINTQQLPSALQGKLIPNFQASKTFDSLGYKTFDFDSLQQLKEPYIVNFFASYCAPCLIEHPVFMRLKKEGVKIYGFSLDKTGEDSDLWLKKHGNPYEAFIKATGESQLDWGVSGIPETFLISQEGRILYRHQAALTEDVWAKQMAPLLTKEKR